MSGIRERKGQAVDSDPVRPGSEDKSSPALAIEKAGSIVGGRKIDGQ
jgi:hypothetical protein